MHHHFQRILRNHSAYLLHVPVMILWVLYTIFETLFKLLSKPFKRHQV